MDNAVYENVTLLNYLRNSKDWNKCLISLFGIDKPGHRFRISLRVKEGELLKYKINIDFLDSSFNLIIQ